MENKSSNSAPERTQLQNFKKTAGATQQSLVTTRDMEKLLKNTTRDTVVMGDIGDIEPF